jgi:hypothetical protein
VLVEECNDGQDGHPKGEAHKHRGCIGQGRPARVEHGRRSLGLPTAGSRTGRGARSAKTPLGAISEHSRTAPRVGACVRSSSNGWSCSLPSVSGGLRPHSPVGLEVTVGREIQAHRRMPVTSLASMIAYPACGATDPVPWRHAVNAALTILAADHRRCSNLLAARRVSPGNLGATMSRVTILVVDDEDGDARSSCCLGCRQSRPIRLETLSTSLARTAISVPASQMLMRTAKLSGRGL